jgi:D-aminopeptidase
MTLRRRARDLGIAPGAFGTGPHNALTDVPGVRVGQVTLTDGGDLQTGVTAIVPDQLLVRKTLPAGLFVGNGYGKLIGATQLQELGEVETPILLTGTLSAFRVADALVTWMLDRPGNEEMVSVNPVVGETNDGWLSDIRSRPITAEHVFAALDGATAGPVTEGCVGAGTGTTALGFKGGIGTSSRLVPLSTGEEAILGVLVQSNFGGTLRVDGIAIPPREPEVETTHPRGNSCMIVVATDARLDSRQLARLATRAVFAMGRVGASFSHGSGDYGIAFSTADGALVTGREIDPLFAAVQDATEEALLNSLFMAESTTGYRGRTVPALDPAVVQIMRVRQGLER